MLFLDFDGTLVNSVPLLEDAYYGFLESFGCQGSRDEFLSLNGPSLHRIVRILQRAHGLKPSLAELNECYLNEIQARESQVELNEGAEELLDTALSRGFVVAIVSSSPRERIVRLVASRNLDPHVSLIVGSEDSNLSKPHPAPYLLAIDSLKADVNASIAVEDSVTGMQSALSAGVPGLFLERDTSGVNLPVLARIGSLSGALPFIAEGT